MNKLIRMVMGAFALLVAGAAGAVDVSEAQARTVASNFVTTDAIGSRSLPDRAVEAVTRRGGMWLVTLRPSGHLFVSANRAAEPIASFSENDFCEPAADSPRAALLALAEANARSATGSKFETQWRSLLGEGTPRLATAGVKTAASLRSATASASSYVAPLLKSSWSQSAPYYDYAPVNAGVHEPNGCVATAFAQIMRYWEWPERIDEDFSTVHTADSTWGFRQQLWAGTALDWSEMPLAGYSTEADRLNVGRAAMLCGMLARMGYASAGSSAQNRDVTRNPWYTLPQGVDCDGTNGDELKAAIRASLTASRPILVGIGNPNHSIVGDGFSKSGDSFYVHLNYGWGGQSTDNYSLTYLMGTSKLSGIFASQRPRPMVLMDAMPAESALPLTLAWAFPKKGYEDELTGFTVRAAEVDSKVFDWTDDFSDSEGASDGSDIAVETIACGNETPVLNVRNAANQEHYTWPAKVVSADSALSFRIRSNTAIGMEVVVQAYNPSTGWETVLTPVLDENSVGAWRTETVSLARYAGRAVGLRIGARRVSLQGASGADDIGVQFDDVRITNVRSVLSTGAGIDVGADARSVVFTSDELSGGKEYVFTVEPKVPGGIVSPAVSTAVVAEEPAAASIDAIASVRSTGEQVRDGFYREGSLGLNQFGVYGSEATTGLVVRLSHPVLIDKSTPYFDTVDQKYGVTMGATSVVHAVSVEKVKNGKFLVKLDFGMLTDYLLTTRMVVTFDALDAKGNVARRHFNLLLNTVGDEEAIAKDQLPDYGGSAEPEPEPEPDPDVPVEDEPIGVASNDGDPGYFYSNYGYTMCDNYWTARKLAIQQRKQLFILSGAAWCSNCSFVKDYLNGLGETVSDNFIVYFSDHDSTTCNCFNGGLPQYGVADPRQIDAFTGTLDGGVRSWDLAWQTASSGLFAQDRGGYAPTRVKTVLDIGIGKGRIGSPTGFVIRGLSALATGYSGQYELYAQFDDGVEMPIDRGVTWTVVSGDGTVAKAAVDGREVASLTIASGDVVLRATSTFYFTGTKTVTVRGTDLTNVDSVTIRTASVNLEDDATPLIDAIATMKDGSTIPVVGFGDWSAAFKGRIDRDDPDLEEANAEPSITFDSNSRLTYGKTNGRLEVCDQKIDVTLTVNGRSDTREITVWGPTKVAPSKWRMISGPRQTKLGVVRLQCTELKYNYGGKIRTTTDTYFASYKTVLKFDSGATEETTLRGLTAISTSARDEKCKVGLAATKVNGKFAGYAPADPTASALATNFTNVAEGAAVTDIAEGSVPRGFFTAFFPERAASVELARDDSDGDGFRNWEEYVLGTDPTDPGDAFTLLQGYQHLTAPAANGETMQYKVMYQQRARRIYTIEAKETWNADWTPVATVSLQNMTESDVTTFTDLDASFADAAKFFRVKAALYEHTFSNPDDYPVIAPEMIVANRGAVIDLSAATHPLDLRSFDTDATDPGTVFVSVAPATAAGTVLIRAPKSARTSLAVCRPYARDDLAFEVVTDSEDETRLILRVMDPDAAPAIEGGDSRGTVEVTEGKIVVTPAADVTEITVVRPGERTVEIPPTVSRLGGVTDVSRIVIRGGGHDITKAMKFTAEADGFRVELDAAAKVKVRESKGGVEVEEEIAVTPELADGTDETPFEVRDGTLVFKVKSIPGLKYQVLSSESLAPDSFAPAGQAQEATSARRELTLARPDGKKGFYKIQVSR